MTLVAEVPVYGGYTLSRNGGVVFLKGAIPGETVEAEIIQKRKDYSVAVVKNILSPSKDRITPACEVYGLCGGCHYQHISYETQVKMKEGILLNCLERIGKIRHPIDGTITGMPWHYRKRVRLKVSRDGRVGFFKPLSHELVEFKECLLLEPQLNEFIRKVKEKGPVTGVKEIQIAHGDITVVSLRGYQIDDELIERIVEAGASGVWVNGRWIYGEERICLPLHGYIYFISPDSFFQANWALNLKLTGMLGELISIIKPQRVLDLYGGAGNISVAVSGMGPGEVIVVESDTLAFRDGLYNLQMNGISNVRFINRAVESLRNPIKAEVVVVDPPRPGLTKKALSYLLRCSPQWIFYLSCNPSTLARDISRLSDDYSIDSIRLIDLFPQTYHIEALCILKRRG